MTLLQHFQHVLAADDSKLAFTRALSCPALLWSASAPALQAWIDTQPPAEQPALTAHLQALQRLGANLAEHLEQWPENSGPIEQLAARLAEGELTWPQALAAAPATASCLSPPYVRILANRTRRQSINGDWQNVVPQYRLLLAATDALGDDAAAVEMRQTVASDWIETVGAACFAVPDGRLFSDAVQRGEALAAQLADPGMVLHRLGVLHLDPYISGRNSSHYAADVHMWMQRLADTYGPMAASDPATAMPEPADALATAVDWFTKALAHRQGEARGLTLKALAEALVWREIAGGPPDREAARGAAREALTLLPAARNAAHVQALHGMLRYLEPATDEPAEDAAPDPPPEQAHLSADLLWLDPADVAARHGATEARQRYFQQARLLVADEPHTAIALMLRLWPTLTGAGAEGARRNAIHILARALVQAADAVEVLEQAGDDTDLLRPALAAAAQEGDWTAGRQAAALAGLAAALTSDAREAEGLDLIGQAIEIAREALPALVAPLAVLQADLTLGEAVNAYDAERWDDATQHYLNAVGLYDAAGMPETAVNALIKAEDVTFAAADRSAAALAVGLASRAGALAARGAPRLADRLQRIWDRVLARIGEQSPANPVLLWLALQGAKGAAFAVMLRHAGYDWRHDEAATGILARIAALRAETPPPDAVAGEEDPLGEALILVGHAGSDGDGKEAEYDPLETLERRFDSLLAQRMTGGEIASDTYLLGDELKAAVGPRSVLMSIHLGRSQDDRLALTTALLGGNDLALARGIARDLPSGRVAMQGRRHAVEMNLFAPVVAGLRDALLEDPWPEAISQQAAATLASDHAMLLGANMPARLAAMRAAGRDHLCIHPHSAYHFHPMHLIGPPGQPLTDDWIVTTVPHPSLLRPRDDADVPQRALALAALGLDFADGQPHGLPALPGAAHEAEAVAAILGGSVHLNAEATRARFFEAITGAQRVHIASHGAHDVTAPAFQRLYLHPDAGSDGIVYAYEIIGLDLRGLDLVTLSACETALGRSDIADTLRGLPAALFVAGVATIVSTLWPVADAPARLFFETLYRKLGEPAAKLDAFRAAQLAVRAAYPEWRDWGAFHYAGRW